MKQIAIENFDVLDDNNSKHPILLTKNGKPISLIIPIDNVDLETLSLSINPKFIDIIEKARKSQQEEGRITLNDIRKELGI